MSNRAKTLIGFAVAGAALLVIADHAPRAAVAMTGVLVLGVVVTHATDIKQLLDTFTVATGHKP